MVATTECHLAGNFLINSLIGLVAEGYDIKLKFYEPTILDKDLMECIEDQLYAEYFLI